MRTKKKKSKTSVTYNKGFFCFLLFCFPSWSKFAACPNDSLGNFLPRVGSAFQVALILGIFISTNDNLKTKKGEKKTARRTEHLILNIFHPEAAHVIFNQILVANIRAGAKSTFKEVDKHNPFIWINMMSRKGRRARSAGDSSNAYYYCMLHKNKNTSKICIEE